MNLKINESKRFMLFLLILLLALLVFSFMLFEVTGLRVVFGIIFISLPFYILLGRFKFGEGEKFVFSALLGLTVFPSLVYLLGLLISFKLSIVIVFVVLMGIAMVLRKYSH